MAHLSGQSSTSADSYPEARCSHVSQSNVEGGGLGGAMSVSIESIGYGTQLGYQWPNKSVILIHFLELIVFTFDSFDP